jgi:hypothetical protein
MELLFSLILQLLSCADMPQQDMEQCVQETVMQIDLVLDAESFTLSDWDNFVIEDELD